MLGGSHISTPPSFFKSYQFAASTRVLLALSHSSRTGVVLLKFLSSSSPFLLASVECQFDHLFSISTRPARPTRAFDSLQTMSQPLYKGPTWPSSSVEHQNLVRPKRVKCKKALPLLTNQSSAVPVIIRSGPTRPCGKEAQHAMPIIPCNSWPNGLFLLSFFLSS